MNKHEIFREQEDKEMFKDKKANLHSITDKMPSENWIPIDSKLLLL